LLSNKTVSHPSPVAVKRRHRCRLVVWHGHPANQINHQSLLSIPLLGFRFSRTVGSSIKSSWCIVPVVCHGCPFDSALTKSKQSIARGHHWIQRFRRIHRLRILLFLVITLSWVFAPVSPCQFRLPWTVHSGGRTAIHIHVACCPLDWTPRTLVQLVYSSSSRKHSSTFWTLNSCGSGTPVLSRGL
jgi:hypothetical protein